jgi:hypothetical protein
MRALGLTAPTPKQVLDIIEKSGEAFTLNTGRLSRMLDTHAPIFAKFVIEEVPPGFPPRHVREQWVGVALPVRMRPYPDTIPVLGFEAIDSLKQAGRMTATVWLSNFYLLEGQEHYPNAISYENPFFAANIDGLEFKSYCGRLEEV